MLNRNAFRRAAAALVLGAGLALAPLSARSAVPPSYLIVDLGTLGGNHSQAAAINKRGQIAGMSVLPDGSGHPFVWSAADGMVNLGTLGATHIDGHYALAINDTGQVSGQSWGAYTFLVPDDLNPEVLVPWNRTALHAFLWTPGGTDGVPTNPQMKDIPPLGDGYTLWGQTPFPHYSYGAGLNGWGQVAVLNQAEWAENWTTVFVHDQGVNHHLGRPPGGLDGGGGGLAINRHGWVTMYVAIRDPNFPLNNGFYQTAFVVRAEDSDLDGKADRWFRDDNQDGYNDLFLALGGLAGGAASYPSAINDLNQVVGFAEDLSRNGYAFFWSDANGNGQTDPGEMLDLGKLPGDDGAYAQWINNAGQIVGASYRTASDGSFHDRPVVWDPVDGMRELQTLIPANSGWTLAQLTGINDNGEICGTGVLNGETRAFLLKPVQDTAPAGEDVTVTPVSSVGVSLTFAEVETPGSVDVTTTNVAPPLPEGFELNGTFIDISVQGGLTFNGPVTITLAYDPVAFPYDFQTGTWTNGEPQLLHGTPDGGWEVVTTTANPVSQLLTGTVTSFSPFAIVRRVPVAYGIGLLYDAAKVYKLGSTVPLKLRLNDAAGANVSSSTRVVTALSWQQVGGTPAGTPIDSGNANPDLNFRYDAELAGYIFNFSTKGLPAAGTYEIRLKAGADPSAHVIPLKVK